MAFPNRIPQKYEFAVSSSGLKHLILVGSFGKICVAIFMFLGGLGLAKQIQANNFHFLKKVWGLYRVYWRVFLYSFHLVFSFLAGNRNIHKRLCGDWSGFVYFSDYSQVFASFDQIGYI